MNNILGKTRLYSLLSLVILGLFAAAPVKAQSTYGSIVGTVTDISGAIVPNATVTITNIGTNDKRTVHSDATGNFSFVDLLPANYRIEIGAPTYKRFVRLPIPVAVDSTVRVDSALEVGSVTETVEVTTAPPLLQTDSGSVSQEVEGKTVQEMPLNGRNTMNLIALAPGVVPQGSTSGSTGLNQPGGNTNSGGWGNYQIGGGIAGQSAEYIDGVAINVIGGNQVALVPTQDAIQEFDVASNSVSAEFGRFAGGVVNMATKSGTNAIHGSAYEYLRNSFFNANDWFGKQGEALAGTPNKPGKWNQNQYGIVVDGPIKKDKAFFLFTWEGFKSATGSTQTTMVPTAAMLDGTVAGQITDPTGKCTGITYTATTSTVPTSCWDSAASVMVKYWDPANASGVGYNYITSVPLGDSQGQYNARIDYNLSDRQQIFGRYTRWNIKDVSFNEFPDNKLNLGNDAVTNATNEVVLGDTVTLNPTTIMDVRVSWMREMYSQFPPSTHVDESQFGGTWGTLAPEMSENMYPVLSGHPTPFGGSYGDLYTSFEGGPNNLEYFNNYNLSASVSKIRGNHSFKLGGEVRKMNLETGGHFDSGGFSFQGQYTGDDWADFLLGYANTGEIETSANVTGYNYYQGYYLQDNWTATKNLTLNLGLRWELPGSIAESNDKNTVLLPYTSDPYTGVFGTLALVNSALYGPRTVQKVKLYLLAPRLGAAYRLGANMAVRAGYGVTYLPPDIGGAMMPQWSPVNGDTSNSYNNHSNIVGAPTLSSPFTTLSEPSGRSNLEFMKQFLNQSITSQIPTDPYPYMQQWNLTFSRQLKGDFMVELGYVGSKGTHLPSVGGGGGPTGNLPDRDELSSQYWHLGTALDADYGTLTTPNGTYSEDVSLGQSLRPYPFYQGVGDANPTWASSTYHAGMLRAVKRFHSGGILMASYTRSKMISDTDTASSFLEVKPSQSVHGGGEGVIQDFNNHKAERSISSYTTPDRFIASYVLPLPFGQGQRYLNSVNGLVGRIASGWAVNGITTFQTGFPLTLTEGSHSDLSQNFGIGTLRPDAIPGCTKTVTGSTRQRVSSGMWFNTACYEAPGTDPAINPNPVGYAVGTEPRVDSTLRSEGQDNWDLSILKSTTMVERTSLEFRAELFNAFNRTQFAPPYTTDNGGNFGGVVSQGNLPRLVQLSLRVKF